MMSACHFAEARSAEVYEFGAGRERAQDSSSTSTQIDVMISVAPRGSTNGRESDIDLSRLTLNFDLL